MFLGLGLDSALRMNGCSSNRHSIIIGIGLCLLSVLFICDSAISISPRNHVCVDNSSFDYVDCSPSVQLTYESVEFICVVRQYHPSLNATLILTNPTGGISFQQMNWSDEGKFTTFCLCSAIGRYSYFIQLSNQQGCQESSVVNHFWITSSIDDKDNDGMSDYWEQKYGLNVSNPRDKDLDTDEDGFSNRMEYEMGTHPLQNQILLNQFYRLKQNYDYFLLSFLLFIIVSCWALRGMRRSSAWL